jgi:hypothetical protein
MNRLCSLGINVAFRVEKKSGREILELNQDPA